MKKLLLILMLAVVSNSAMAEWVVIGALTGTTNKGNLYVDPTTIRKSGSKVKMWSLIDYILVQGKAGDKHLSSMTRDEYDCKEDQAKILSSSHYSENMGGGDVVYVRNKPDKHWSPIAPRSVSEGLWKFACGK